MTRRRSPLLEQYALLAAEIRACRICRDAPRYGLRLPHEPRPVFQASPTASICIVSQAPGARVHLSGRPYTDASGDRLRFWLGIDDHTFYDASKVAIVPMGFCFPGNDEKGGDLPPRRECAEVWHERLLRQMPHVELLLVIGQYAQRWHLGRQWGALGVTGTVARWRELYFRASPRRIVVLPHPSWRNTAWLKRNPWFECELLPVLRADVQSALRRRVVLEAKGGWDEG